MPHPFLLRKNKSSWRKLWKNTPDHAIDEQTSSRWNSPLFFPAELIEHIHQEHRSCSDMIYAHARQGGFLVLCDASSLMDGRSAFCAGLYDPELHGVGTTPLRRSGQRQIARGAGPGKDGHALERIGLAGDEHRY